MSVQSAVQAVYRQEVARWLSAHGVKNPQVSILKIWRVDLEGDGVQEVLINAVRQHGAGGLPENVSPDAAAGDYSLLLVRRVVGKSVKTVSLVSEIYPKAKKFNAPSVHDLTAVLDLNGDGRLEIVVRGRYYEGDWVDVWEYHGGAWRVVLSAGCGV